MDKNKPPMVGTSSHQKQSIRKFISKSESRAFSWNFFKGRCSSPCLLRILSLLNNCNCYAYTSLCFANGNFCYLFTAPPLYCRYVVWGGTGNLFFRGDCIMGCHVWVVQCVEFFDMELKGWREGWNRNLEQRVLNVGGKKYRHLMVIR